MKTVSSIAMNDGRHKAILQRLEDALTGNSTYKTTWKTSRVIWKAGEYKLTAAIPLLINLVEKGDQLQRYAAIWSLGKCGDASAVPILKSYFENRSVAANIRQLAANGLLLTLPTAGRAQLMQYFIQGLPVVFQEAIRKEDESLLVQLLQDRVRARELPAYPMLEELYIIAADNNTVKQALHTFLLELPLRPAYFQHIRHLFKQAALRDDHEMIALLAGRFEREPAVIEQKSAYSGKTRAFLHRQILRQLRQWGQQEDVTYVRLATALLLQYDGSRDTTAPYQTSSHSYINGKYTAHVRQYPANAAAVYFNYILHGDAPGLLLNTANNSWYYQLSQSDKNQTTEDTDDADTKKSGFFKKLFGWLSGKKTPPPPKWTSPESTPESKQELPTVTEVPFLHIWQQLPEAFIQLLIHGRMEDIHVFALQQLKAHAEYGKLKKNMGAEVIRGLLLSSFQLPQQYGFELAIEKYNPDIPSRPLMQAMIYSPLKVARQLGLQWVRTNQTQCLSDIDFINQLIFCPWKEVRQYTREQLSTLLISDNQARLLTSKAITMLCALSKITPEENDNINEGCLLLEQHCRSILRELELGMIEALLQSRIPANHAFAARLLLLKQKSFNYDGVPDSLFHHLLANDYAPVRAAGMGIITAMRPEQQLKRPELIMYCCLAPHQDTRQQIRRLLPSLIQLDPRLAIWLVNELVPRLVRKETYPGIHMDIADILHNELVNHLHDIDAAAALKLLYANYQAAQTFGVLVLEKYIPAAALSIKQVIAAGNHELIVVRKWCWRFFEQNMPRIRYERDTAISLLDASWEDTRQFAQAFFMASFTEEDWTPEVLITIADSVRPDMSAFGRELLTRYFKAADGITYLLKLSQHPSIKMQSFATAYLENYATDNLNILQSLEYYFRTVLTRVNKARVAKNKVFDFLEKEALKSPEAATYIGRIIADISATVSIGDKARCITIMRNIQQQFDVALPIQWHAIVVRA
jgi:hypothetical protein